MSLTDLAAAPSAPARLMSAALVLEAKGPTWCGFSPLTMPSEESEPSGESMSSVFTIGHGNRLEYCNITVNLDLYDAVVGWHTQNEQTRKKSTIFEI